MARAWGCGLAAATLPDLSTAVVFVRRRLGVFSPSDGGGGLRWTAPVCPVERPRRLSSPSRGGGLIAAVGRGLNYL